jgi:hypothetical protein
MALGFNNVARNDLARVFLFPDGVYKCGASGVYASCVSVDALAQDRGDITNIECPSPYRYGEFEVVGSLPGELSRMTTTLTGHMSRTDISTFYKLFIQNCKFDVHLHFGLCQAPNNFSQFDKALVFEDVNVTAFSTDPLVALQSGDRAAVNESIDISIGRFYEVVNLEYNERGTAVTTHGAIVATAVCDLASCGSECDVNSDGCQKMFAASTDGYIYYSDDRGQSWTELEIEDATPVTPQTPNAVLDLACWGDNIVVLDDANQLWVINRDDLIDGTATTFGIVDTAITNLASKLSTSQNQMGIIVGDNGDIAMFSDLEAGSTLVDAGFTTTEDLTAVHVGMDGTIVAGGTNGAVVYSYDGITWYNSPTVPVAQTITDAVAKNRYNWIVGTANGQIWCTDNSGRTWTRGTYPNWAAATAQIDEFAMASAHVLYFVADNKLYRSLDGGNSWMTEPNTKKTFPTNTALNAVSACWYDVNFALVGGIGAATGVIINGTAPQ